MIFVVVVDPEKLITTQEAADALGISRTTLIRYAERSYVTPARVLPSGHRRWRLDDLRRQLAELPPRGERDT